MFRGCCSPPRRHLPTDFFNSPGDRDTEPNQKYTSLNGVPPPLTVTPRTKSWNHLVIQMGVTVLTGSAISLRRPGHRTVHRDVPAGLHAAWGQAAWGPGGRLPAVAVGRAHGPGKGLFCFMNLNLCSFLGLIILN